MLWADQVAHARAEDAQRGRHDLGKLLKWSMHRSHTSRYFYANLHFFPHGAKGKHTLDANIVPQEFASGEGGFSLICGLMYEIGASTCPSR